MKFQIAVVLTLPCLFPVSTAQDSTEIHLALSSSKPAFVAREPLLLEWSIRNLSPRPLSLTNLGEALHMQWTLADHEGAIRTASFAGSLGKPTIQTIGLGSSYRGWINLSDLFAEVTPGQYTLRAKYDNSSLGGVPEFWTGTFSSEALILQIDLAEGKDAIAASLVAEALDRRGEGGHMQLFYVDQELCKKLIASPSERFRSAGQFYLGMRRVHDFRWNKSLSHLEPGKQALRACYLDSSNAYLRGLASAYLLEATLGTADTPTPAWNRQAQSVMRRFPDSFPAQRARELAIQVTTSKQGH